MNERGQITIWVLVALAIVGGLLLFFIFQRSPELVQNEEFNPRNFLKSCIQSGVEEGTGIMYKSGGFINEQKGVMYLGMNRTYLCYNSGNYLPCVNQHPMLINEMKEELKEFLKPRFEECYQNLKLELEGRNDEVEFGELNFSVYLKPDEILIDIEKEIVIKENSQIDRFDGFEFGFESPLWNLGNIGIEIASQEAKYCYFEYVGYNNLHPRFIIKKTSLGDGSKIYTIEDTKMNEEMIFAIRGCAIPPGI
jgi:hypothetical protein